MSDAPRARVRGYTVDAALVRSTPDPAMRLTHATRDARLDVLATYGIAVHRVLGEHPAVHRANRRLGYL